MDGRPGAAPGVGSAVVRVPRTTSAAYGMAVREAASMVMTVAVPRRLRRMKPTSASLRRWCEQVDWPMPMRRRARRR